MNVSLILFIIVQTIKYRINFKIIRSALGHIETILKNVVVTNKYIDTLDQLSQTEKDLLKEINKRT